MSKAKTFLCIASFYKGAAFLEGCKAAGNNVLLVTSKHLENEPWPWEAIDDVFYIEADKNEDWNLDHLIGGVGHLMKSQKIDRVVALDDFDVEKGTAIREHFRIPGMGQSTGRFFRDKLAMRLRAKEYGIPVPLFSGLFNDESINEFIAKTTFPCVVKPRGEASATGISKVHSGEELWAKVHELGERRSQFLVEQFLAGDVYHIDSLSAYGDTVFNRVSRYLSTPMEVAHEGGVFRSRTVKFGSTDEINASLLTRRLLLAFNFRFGAGHTELIKSKADGKFYFLETASRVGGAHLAEMVEASSGINLWYEWARIESSVENGTNYDLPKYTNTHAGIIVSLSKYKHPDYSQFTDKEIWWKMEKEQHIGLIVKSRSSKKVTELLDDYAGRILSSFHASIPAPDAPDRQ